MFSKANTWDCPLVELAAAHQGLTDNICARKLHKKLISSSAGYLQHHESVVWGSLFVCRAGSDQLSSDWWGMSTLKDAQVSGRPLRGKILSAPFNVELALSTCASQLWKDDRFCLQLFGKMHFIAGYTNNDAFKAILNITDNSWVEFSEVPGNPEELVMFESNKLWVHWPAWIIRSKVSHCCLIVKSGNTSSSC